MFNIAAGATIAGGVADNGNFSVFVPIKRPLSVSQRPEALSTSTSPVAIANNYTNLCFRFHVTSDKNFQTVYRPSRCLKAGFTLFFLDQFMMVGTFSYHLCPT